MSWFGSLASRIHPAPAAQRADSPSQGQAKAVGSGHQEGQAKPSANLEAGVRQAWGVEEAGEPAKELRNRKVSTGVPSAASGRSPVASAHAREASGRDLVAAHHQVLVARREVHYEARARQALQEAHKWRDGRRPALPEVSQARVAATVELLIRRDAEAGRSNGFASKDEVLAAAYDVLERPAPPADSGDPWPGPPQSAPAVVAPAATSSSTVRPAE